MKAVQDLALKSHLKELRLPTVLREYAKTAADAAKESLGYEGYLQRLCAAEIADRESRAFGRRLKLARLPSKKTIAEFDFHALPDLEPLTVHRLAGCEFVAKRENVLLVGSSGTGKTHLATALAVEACKAKHSVRFYTVSELVEMLLEARSERSLGRARAQLKKVDLLVLDELGFVPLPPSGAELLFDVVSDRYEKGAIVLTTNLPFEEWISVLASEALTHALLDRLTHHVHILQMNGRSYRLSQSLKSAAKRNVTLEPPEVSRADA
ncbi:MAG: ATP-binding protein [Acidobacteria bacterium]|nr:ATP-binding protein [Acidobacteriota bacterium]